MPSRKLPHYIKSHRKRSGFSQSEVAFLLEARHSAAISRYEHFKQQPNLETAIALEILFRTPVRGIFAGVSDKVERRIASRADLLVQKLKRQPRHARARRKIEMLDELRSGLGQLPAQQA